MSDLASPREWILRFPPEQQIEVIFLTGKRCIWMKTFQWLWVVLITTATLSTKQEIVGWRWCAVHSHRWGRSCARPYIQPGYISNRRKSRMAGIHWAEHSRLRWHLLSLSFTNKKKAPFRTRSHSSGVGTWRYPVMRDLSACFSGPFARRSWGPLKSRPYNCRRPSFST